jgi:hypothetical protein
MTKCRVNHDLAIRDEDEFENDCLYNSELAKLNGELFNNLKSKLIADLKDSLENEIECGNTSATFKDVVLVEDYKILLINIIRDGFENELELLDNSDIWNWLQPLLQKQGLI